MGLSHIVIFGGEGISLSAGDVLKIIYSNENLTGDLDSNQQVAVDFALRIPNVHKVLPLAHSIKLYAEAGAEDTGFLPDRRAFLVGSRFYDFLMVKKLQATIEYADTSPGSVPGAWYRHPKYPATFEEKIFGHHVGTDAENLFFELSYDINEKTWARVIFDYEKRGVSERNPEESFEGRIRIEHYLNNWARIDFTYGYEKVFDLDHVDGLEQTNQLFGIRAYFQF
jgi:hypothetical protein